MKWRYLCAWTATWFFLIGSSSSTVLAATCDPDKILRQNIDQYNENIGVWLAYIKNLSSSTKQSDNSSIGISYDGVGLSYSDANSLAQYINQHESYSLTQLDTVSILRSTLSPDSVRAYIACLNSNNPVTVVLPEAAVNETAFPFTVEWNPNYPAKKNATLTILVTNGTIEGKAKITATMSPTDVMPFQVLRDNNGQKTLFITAYIFGKTSDPVSMPGIPQFKISLKPKLSKSDVLCRSGQCGTSYVKRDLCIDPDAGSMLLPSTLKFVTEQMVGDPRRANAAISDGNTIYHSCGYIQDSAGGNEDYNYIAGHFTMMETYLEVLAPGATVQAAGPRRGLRFGDIETLQKAQ